MLTAMRAVENVLDGSKHDLWAVNAESAYHEEHQEPEQPYKRVPATQYEREPLHALRRPPPRRTDVRLAASQGDAILIERLRRAFGRNLISRRGQRKDRRRRPRQ